MSIQRLLESCILLVEPKLLAHYCRLLDADAHISRDGKISNAPASRNRDRRESVVVAAYKYTRYTLSYR